MEIPGPAAENPVESALRLANEAVERGLIGGYAVAGAFAFIFHGEPFETKDLDLMSLAEPAAGRRVACGHARISD